MELRGRTVIPAGRRIIFALITSLTLLGTLELLTRALLNPPAEPTFSPASGLGWQPHFFGSLFDWHEPDPDLLWRFRPNLCNRLIKTNSRGLIADETPYDKPPNTFRVLVLGDSSPVGLGLPDRTAAFPDILKRRLMAAAPTGLYVEVINAAVSGYSSEQIVRFYSRQGRRYHPDVVILYCGNNDASISGPRSDQKLLQDQCAVSLRRVLQHLTLYRALTALLLPHPERIVDTASDSAMVPRVTPSRFAHNLARLARLCQQDGCHLIPLVPSTPLLWPAGLQFRPLRHLTCETGELIFPDPIRRLLGHDLLYCIDDRRQEQVYGQADKFTRSVYASAPTDSQPPDIAVRIWQEQARRNPSPAALNNLGVALWRSRAYAEADSILSAAIAAAECEPSSSCLSHQAAAPLLYNRGVNALDALGYDWEAAALPPQPAAALLDSAFQCDWFSLRIKRPYADSIRALARFNGVTVIDLPRLFASRNEHLFIDHCHPTPQGHRLIADTLTAILSSSLTSSRTLPQKRL